MNINTKLKHTAISLVIVLILAVSTAPVLPAYAAVGTSVNEEVVNQARSIASVIQTRIQLYWSMWVDKQIPYTQDPLTNPEPTWPSDQEIAAAIGGYEVDGITFSVDNMPADRKGSFYLRTTIDSDMGGAAAASYVRNFLPMAVASSNEIIVPILRPSFALGLSDLADNPNKVNRDGATDDGEPTFADGANITFGDNGSITFDPVTGGDINNVRNLNAKNGNFSNNLNVGNKLTAANAEITDLTAGRIKATEGFEGDLTGNVTGNLTGNVNGNVNGNLKGNVEGNVTGNVNGNVTGNAGTATRLAVSRVIALANGASGSRSFDGTSDIVIPVTLNADYLNYGTIDTARLSGEYGITAARAKYATATGLLKNIENTETEGAGNFSMKLSSGGNIIFDGSVPDGIVKFGVTGAVTPSEYQFGLNGNAVLKGIAASATRLAVARTIMLSEGVTGSGSFMFDGSDGAIRVTGVDAGKLNTGTILTERLSGTYNIGISGRATTAGAADTAVSAATATSAASAGKLSAARDFNVTGAASGTAASFDGTGNVNIAVNSLDPTKLMAVDAAGLGVRHNAVSYNSSSPSLTGAIKIKVPGGRNIHTMMNIEIDVYEYDSSSASKIIIGGYAYSAGGNWHNASVSVSGGYSKGVRLASDGSGFCIILGSPSSVWHYPKINVSKVTAGHANTSDIAYGTWTASLITSDSGLVNIVAPEITSAQSATQLATARTIALGTAATGTPTAFDGSVNITIPVTALNASYLNAGTISTARLSGYYGIDISGTARYAQELSSPITSVAYADTAKNATTALKAGDGTNMLYAERGNEINFGGSSADSTIYFGYKAHDSKAIPTVYVFGNTAAGTATVKAKTFIGELSGNASSATTVTTPSGTYKHIGAWGVGRTDPGAILVNTAYRADIATTAQNIAGGIPGGMVPVYSARQSYGKDVTHTAPKNGYIMLSFGFGTFQIAGVTLINSTYVDFCSKHTQDVYVFPIRHGDTFRLSGGNLYYMYFVPKDGLL